MKEMSSRQRVAAAFEHRQPDHVPCWMGASPEFKAIARDYLGLPDDESLAVYIGDDFRQVYARYAGPDDRHPPLI
jgi:uroporphyrinogen-III decarboxylase